MEGGDTRTRGNREGVEGIERVFGLDQMVSANIE
jgi:hypothetical protein